MSRIVDNLIAYKILTMLITPFEETEAFKLGVIDKDGKNLIKTSKLQTSEQKDSYTYLNRLVFNIKKIINRLPGGDTKLKNLVAAFWLVKESYENKREMMIEDCLKILNNDITLVEEEILVKEFLQKKQKELEEEGEGGAPANSTSATGAVGIAVPKKKDIDKYKAQNTGMVTMTRRAKPVE
jgi:hypothetical protein